MNAQTLSDTQLRILLYIVSYIDVYGHAPVSYDIQQDLKLSISTVNRQLIRLDDSGFLERRGVRNWKVHLHGYAKKGYKAA